MRIIVTHTSPDWDAIGSVWLIRKFLPGWNGAHVKFVPAGERLSSKFKVQSSKLQDTIERIGEDEVIHVDTGMGPLDHHQTSDTNISATGLTWEYVKKIKKEKLKRKNSDENRWNDRQAAVSRIVKVIVDTDHFKEVFWESPTADHHDFSLLGVLDGLKLYKPDDDGFYMEFGFICLDALLDHFLNKLWAEEEISKNSISFTTKWGKGIGFETINDTVLKLAQKMGYVVVVRKDPRKGYVRIKARPDSSGKWQSDVNLTLAYEKLKKIDPDATWYLHISKKMLLNGTVKNPKMRPTKLSLGEIVKVLETI